MPYQGWSKDSAEPSNATAPIALGSVPVGGELKFRVIAEWLRRDIRGGVFPPGGRLPTERVLADRTGTSVSTVRRAVDDLVAEDLVVRRQGSGTYVRVRQRPGARALIGVIVPDTGFYYPRVLAGIEQVRAAVGARVELACSRYDQAVEQRVLAGMLDAGAQGLLLVPTLSGPEPAGAYLRRLVSLPVPVVVMERRGVSAGDANERVCTHHEAGAFDAVGHLAGLGHRAVGLVLRYPSPTAVPVAAGYRQAVREFGLAAVEFRAELQEWGPATADRALACLRGAGCTAALCFGDRQAALVLSAARRAGLGVPGDLALVAYDDEIAAVPDVPLTAVCPPKRLLGRTAAEVLLHRLEHPGGPRRQILLRPTLTIRQSCGATQHAASTVGVANP